MGIRTTLSLAAAGAAFIGASAQAGIITPDLSMQVLRYDDVGGENFEAWAETGAMTENGGGQFIFNTGQRDGQVDYDDPFGWNIDYGVTYDTGQLASGGPVDVFLDFGLTNNTGTTETFTVVANVPLLVALANTSVLGSVEGGYQDANFTDGATLSSDGLTPIYQGLVDGTSSLDLLTGGFISSIGFGSTTIGPVNGANAGPALAMTDIGIVMTFTLTDGDSANFTADFQITGDKIPAPGVLALFGLAGLAGTRRRRH